MLAELITYMGVSVAVCLVCIAVVVFYYSKITIKEALKMAIPTWAVSIGTKLVMTAISKKFADESNDERLVREANNIPQVKVFAKSEVVKAVPLWLMVVGVLLAVANSLGYIDANTYEVLKDLVSNPEAIEAVELVL